MEKWENFDPEWSNLKSGSEEYVEQVKEQIDLFNLSAQFRVGVFLLI
jgi:hypothetical protein